MHAIARRLPLAALAGLTALLLSACGSSDDGTPTQPGGGGGAGPSFNFSFPATGASHSFTFSQAGSFDYRCSPHSGSGMTGTVVVSASSTNDSALVNVGSGGLLFDPPSVTIQVGGTVRWVNVSGLGNHTVTRP